MSEEPTLGQLLKWARAAKGLSQEALALDLKLPLRHIQAIESDEWAALPPGRQRPLARQLAHRLDLDLERHPGAFQFLPGGREEDVSAPQQERLERVVMGLLTAASGLVVLWLVVPRGSLGGHLGPSYLTTPPRSPLPPPPPRSTAPYPVLGELLPETPLNEQGVLVSLRAMDTCEVRVVPSVETGGTPMGRTLRISEPWRLRVQGPFALSLDNAGVVNVEVAGRRILHGQNVREAWTGRFDAAGRWLKPPPPLVLPAQLALPELPAIPDEEDEAEDGTKAAITVKEKGTEKVKEKEEKNGTRGYDHESHR